MPRTPHTSALAAFSSILTGGWDDGAANLAWFFTILASLLALAGLCQRQHPENSQIPFIAVALMVTTPLLTYMERWPVTPIFGLWAERHGLGGSSASGRKRAKNSYSASVSVCWRSDAFIRPRAGCG